MSKLKLSFLTLLTCFFSFGQTENYSEKEIIEYQRITTTKIIVALQNGNVESILQYFCENIKDLQSKLESSRVEIEKIKTSTRLSDVVVFDEDSHIFRCRYSDTTRARFQMDLYFQTDNPNSKVVELKTKTDEVLKKAYQRRINNTAIPSAPLEPNRE